MSLFSRFPTLREQFTLRHQSAHLHQLLLRRISSHTCYQEFHHTSIKFLRACRTHPSAIRCRGRALRQPSRRFQTTPRKQGPSQPNRAPENARPNPDPTPQLGSPQPRSAPASTLSERLRKLSREYGWTALGVYLALSALDFPFCFLAVRMLGTDRIGRWEQNVVYAFWTVVSVPFPGGEEQARRISRNIRDIVRGEAEAVDHRESKDQHSENSPDISVAKPAGQPPDAAVVEEKWSWGVDEAEAAHRDHACEFYRASFCAVKAM